MRQHATLTLLQSPVEADWSIMDGFMDLNVMGLILRIVFDILAVPLGNTVKQHINIFILKAV